MRGCEELWRGHLRCLVLPLFKYEHCVIFEINSLEEGLLTGYHALKCRWKSCFEKSAAETDHLF